MEAQQFDVIVKARANERVQEKIRQFRKTCQTAFEHLAILASDNHTAGWPRRLWEEEKKVVAKELLEIMDEIQNAVLAASRTEPGENTSKGEEAEKEF